MKEYIQTRVLELAKHIIDTRTTVRDASKVFSISKSTVHKDVTERLMQIDYQIYLEVKKVLEYNLSERHIRGGIATREKYKKEA